ncbi:SdiA-regulated domain-containing protein [Pseudomonas sp. MPFS]|uniref:SdiA-regulated domain-containing protein n=1 Tax=Pseudomonas sp. MPFS TaxID=2795724 RepID=UPI001F130158|nr:SdiA-regulated domain-containing protein [Pseudomonas sp. MPFS]UMZ11776.1 SdiA-regulated domain-containing protein [Pseudomonas sp. MPFS]
MYPLSRLHSLSLLLCLVAVLFVAFAHNQRLWQRAWFDWQAYWQAGDPRSLSLGDYRVVREAQLIEGLDDVSALTYDPLRNSLFTVTNKNAELIELSLEGQVLRRIALAGFTDPEAVEFISADTYVISDERQQRLVKIHLQEDTTQVDAALSEQVTLGMHLGGNKGFEGLAYDASGKRLFVAKERDPMLIYEVRGFPDSDPHAPRGMHVVNDPKRDAGLFVRDLSSLQYDAGSGHLLALSDESRLIVELDTEGRPLSTLALGRGRQGLSKAVPQAEGMAMDKAGTLYLVSEPNLFYVFRKPGE